MSANAISVVTCSVYDGKFNELKQNLAHIFGDSLKMIRINDAKSMAEGYNSGARLPNGDILIFCHDDIEILNKGVPEIINSDLENFDAFNKKYARLLPTEDDHTKYAIQRFPFLSKKRLFKKMYSFIGLSNYELSKAKEI